MKSSISGARAAKIIGIAVVSALVIVSVFILKPKRTAVVMLPKTNGTLDSAASRRLLADRIREIGAGQAYNELKAASGAEDFSVSHTAAHLFGELMYDSSGVDGIAECDSSFSYGCYHGFFGRAIAKMGITAVSLFDQACVDRFGVMGLGCPHGIGHGLGEYFGPERLVEQLANCAALSWKGPLFGCAGGVFMEHNFPTIVGSAEATASIRQLNTDDPYDPCPNVPQKFRRACYFELASWWEQAYQQDYYAVGRLCEGVRNVLERRDCFRGIGTAAVATHHYRNESVAEACRAMPTEDAHISCLAGASWGFFAEPTTRQRASEPCSLLGEEGKTQCLEQADLLSY